MSVHRTLDGDWAECFEPACPLRFHFEELDLEEARAMPMQAVIPLFNLLDPPDQVRVDTGTQVWLTETPNKWPGQIQGKYKHRDYDLPAFVSPTGSMAWYQHGKLHRDGGKPAVISPTGVVEYWIAGKQVAAP